MSSLVCPQCARAISEDERYHLCSDCRRNYHLDHRCPMHPQAEMILSDSLGNEPSPRVIRDIREPETARHSHIPPPHPPIRRRSTTGRRNIAQPTAAPAQMTPIPPGGRGRHESGESRKVWPLILMLMIAIGLLGIIIFALMRNTNTPIPSGAGTVTRPEAPKNNGPAGGKTSDSPNKVPEETKTTNTGMGAENKPGVEKAAGSSSTASKETPDVGTNSGKDSGREVDVLPPFDMGVISVCSGIFGWKDYRPQSHFKVGDPYYIYSEAMNVLHNGRVDVTFSYEISDPTGRVIIPRYSSGGIEAQHHSYAQYSGRINESWRPGSYTVRVWVRDNTTGVQKSGTSMFSVEPLPSPIIARNSPAPVEVAPSQPLGTIIWEGILNQEMEVIFISGSVNIGRVTGSLPGVRCRVSITSKSNIDSISFVEGPGVTSFSSMVVRVKPKKSGQAVRFTIGWQT
ncbi:MAG: hypothetical protein V7641_4551 [Blastocatellia bacterium]